MRPPPFKHQAEELAYSRDLHSRALWWEQGTGKTRVVIDTAAHLYAEGKITGLLILAPPGVEANWILDEIPTHMPEEVKWNGLIWSTKRRKTKAFQEQCQELMRSPFPVLAITYPALMVDDAAAFVRKFLDKFRCLYVADESTRIKTPGAKITKRALASAKYAPYRRVLNGTPVTDSPFHSYSQVLFADPNAWRSIGVHDFQQFKTFFGVWQKIDIPGGHSFPKLIRLQNLDIMQRVMMQVGSRLLKKDVLDLPEKLYSKHYFELSSEQQRLYSQLVHEMVAQWDDEGETTAEMAIVRLMRLQQITSGYLPRDGEDLAPIGTNPRPSALMSVLEDVEGSAIIWAKYSIDIDVIKELLGADCVTYDGRTSPEDREIAKRRFQDGEVRFFVAKPSAAGRGLTLTRASTVIYYNNDFVLDNRLQSEDRAHRIGTKNPVRYIDIVARNTVDEHILDVLRGKRVMSSTITGDELLSWA